MKSERTTYLNTTQTARILGVCPQTLRRYISTGLCDACGIHPVKRNRRWYFSAEDIDRFIELHNANLLHLNPTLPPMPR